MERFFVLSRHIDGYVEYIVCSVLRTTLLEAEQFFTLTLYPCLADPRKVRNLREDGPPQEQFAWGVLEG